MVQYLKQARTQSSRFHSLGEILSRFALITPYRLDIAFCLPRRRVFVSCTLVMTYNLPTSL